MNTRTRKCSYCGKTIYLKKETWDISKDANFIFHRACMNEIEEWEMEEDRRREKRALEQYHRASNKNKKRRVRGVVGGETRP